ncbi:MAG: hypothetical protein HY512_02345 [Candidatus Aenigmarchaeota archaeon]|nr:hypothetical protein [Candidatus Aenigmarchaeota archaeon]
MTIYVRIGPDGELLKLTRSDAKNVYQAMFERDPLFTLSARFDPINPTEIDVSAPEKLMRELGYMPKGEFSAPQNDQV